MASGIEGRRGGNGSRGNSEDSAEFPRYSWYDENNDTWYFVSSIEELQNLWENLSNE